MVYKKYIKRGGKVYGPYVYKSRKENGKVITEYLGTHKEYKKKKSKGNKKLSREFFFVLGIFLIFLLMFVMNLSPTGKVFLSIEDSYIIGEEITGELELGIKSGELIPISSKLLINSSGEVFEYLLSDLVSQEIVNGSFYVEGSSVVGEGQGYGFIGEKKIYPEISFELELIEKQEESGGEQSESPDETPGNESGEDVVNASGGEIEEQENLNESSVGEGVEEDVTTQEEVIVDENVNEEVVEEEIVEEESVSGEVESEEIVEEPVEPEPSESEDNSEGGIPITGGVINDNFIEGIVTKENNFIYNLEEGWTVRIKNQSVMIGGEEVLEENINLVIENAQAIISTEYFESVLGFGEEFLTEEINKFVIDLSQFELIAQEGIFSISLIYGEEELTSVSKVISVEEILENKTVGQNMTEVNVTINMTKTNVTDVNVTEVNVTELIERESLLQYKAIIGRPTKWIKAIKVGNETNLSIEIPKKAINVSIKTGEEVLDALNELQEYEDVIEESSREEIVNEGITGMVSLEIRNSKGILTRFFEWLSNLGMTGNIILEEEIETKIIETNSSKIVEVDKFLNLTEVEDVAVEYYTDAPVAVEEGLSNGKKITISADDELGYEDILAYTLIDKKISMNTLSRIKLYWNVNESQNQTSTGDMNNAANENINQTSNKTIEEGISVNESTNQKINETVVETNQTSNETTNINNSTNETEIVFGITGQTIAETNFTNETIIDTNSSTNETGIDLNSSTNETIFVPEIIRDPITNATIKMSVEFHAYDFDNDGYVDYIEWIVPHLSEQIYEMIYITSAEHLDSNKTFISDIYNETKSLDGVWSEVINNSEYVRVSFEKELDNNKDITIYARSSTNTSASIEVYTENGNTTIAVFENILNESTYKVLLTELNGSFDTFDLKINGSVEFDYIVDPSLSITAGTKLNFDGNTTLYHTTVKINDTRYLDIYRGLDSDGYAVVLQVDGTTVSKPGVPFEFETDLISSNTIIKINETRFLAVYTGPGNDGYAVVLQVDGTTVSKPGSAFEFEPGYMVYPSLVRINDTHYLCTHGGPGLDGFANIFEIDGTTVTNVSSFEYDTVLGGFNSLVKINDTRYLNTHHGDGADGYAVLLQLDGLTITNVSNLEYDTDQGTHNALVKMNNTHYINVFDSTDHDGYAVVLQVDGTTISNGTDIEYDKYYGEFPSHVNISETYSLVANTGKDNDGYVRILELNGMTVSNVSTLEYDTDNGWYPSLVKINQTDYLNVYSGNDYNGTAVVFSISGLPSLDSCSYSSGDWNVACSDNCEITSDVDMGGNNIDISGTGTFTINGANVTNYGDLIIRGTDSSNKCNVRCLNGGCFVRG